MLDPGQKYCRKCGHRLGMIAHPAFYGMGTGEQRYHIHGRCPNKKRAFDGHSKGWIMAYIGRFDFSAGEASVYTAK